MRRDETRYENTGGDHSDNDVGERRRRAHGNLVRLTSEPITFNASYGAGVPAFAFMALSSAKLKSFHSRDHGDMFSRVGQEQIGRADCLRVICVTES
jgi:hypothetical protein